MTIRFITAWNGYRADQVVSGLGGAEETRLIGLGFAVADLDGPDNTPLPVVATTNLTGEIEVSAGDRNVFAANGIPFQRKTTAVSRLFGLSVAGGDPSAVTRCLKVEAEAPFTRVRFHLYSEVGAATVFKCAAAATETAGTGSAAILSQPIVGGTTYAALQSAVGAPGWQLGTVAGVGTFDWPGSGTSNLAKELVTDWFDICSVPRADVVGARPLIMFRLEHDSSVNGNIGSGNVSPWRTEASAQTWFREWQGGTILTPDGVTNIAGTFAALSTVTGFIGVEFDYATPATTVMGCGDSNTENSGTNSLGDFGTWLWQGVMGASTQSRPLNYFNAGQSGGTTALYSANADTEIRRIAPEVVVYSAGTVNDNPVTDIVYQAQKSRLSKVINACRSVGAKLIVWGPIPASYTAPQEVFRASMIAHCTNLASLGVINYINFETLLGTGASPNRLAALMQVGDHTHVSNAAEVLMADMLQDELSTII